MEEPPKYETEFSPLAALAQEQEQVEAAVRQQAQYTALFYHQLVADGVPMQVAVALTTVWLNVNMVLDAGMDTAGDWEDEDAA